VYQEKMEEGKMRNRFLGVAALSLVFLLNSRLPAVAGNDAQEAGDASVVNLHNSFCPVTMQKLDEKTKVTYEYKGKIYGFCCKLCVEEFKKDPDKYIKAILRDGGKKIYKTNNKKAGKEAVAAEAAAEEENAQDNGDEQ
jgi:YHS domain-containing protein